MEYIRPNKKEHKYVIGIDFGHGETSADICNIQWDDSYLKLSAPEPIEIFNGVHAIKSVLLIEILEGQKKYYIGQQAINRYSNPKFHSQSDSFSFYSYFKKIPSTMSLKEKEIMCDFMAEVYQQIRRQRQELTEGNHVVYIACPSNSEKWTENELMSYADIALKAGIPLAKIEGQSVGIIRESRAAFLKARTNPSSKASVKEGILLIDFGSSTVDLTYYSSRYTKKPIDDGGEKCGASNVEIKITQELKKRNPIIVEAISTINSADTALLLTMREAKEKFYTYEGEDMECSISLTKITGGAIKGNVEEFFSNADISSILTGYLVEIRECFEKFRDKYIAQYPIKLIFMTGGASRMSFIQDIAREAFQYKGEFYKETNPSLTISNGIALAGRADMRTYAMEEQLLQSSIIASADIATKTIDSAASAIAKEVIQKVESDYSYFASKSSDDSISSLESDIKRTIDQINFSSYLSQAYNTTLKEIANEQIMPPINNIVRDYFPDFEIPNIEANTMFSLHVNANSIPTLSSMISSSLSKITEGFIEGLAKVAWNIAFGGFAVAEGVLINAGVWVINRFRDSNKQIDYIDIEDFVDEFTIGFRDKQTKLSSTRRADVKKVFVDNKSTYQTNICSEIKNALNADSSLKTQLNEKGRAEIKNYIRTQIANARLMLN